MAPEKPRILFVDDEINVLKALERSLHGRRHEWELSFLVTGESAVKEAKACQFDVVVTDLTMPGVSGLDVVRSLNKFSPETRCIILTGTADLQIAAEIINTVRVFRFYTKPCTVEVLAEGIIAALADANSSFNLGEYAPDDGHENIVLDRLSTGVLLVTRKGKVLYMNQAAAETVAAADGLSIGYDQVLRASTSEESRNLQEIFHQLNSVPGDDDVVALSIERPSLRETLKLIIAPMENPNVDPEGRVIVFVTDPEKKSFPTTEMIARLFDLTPVESRLAWELISGQRTEEIAESMGITILSVRTYLKRLMEKTGTNRQVDLVRLLLGTPQIVARSETRST